jgi:hypothetical protein
MINTDGSSWLAIAVRLRKQIAARLHLGTPGSRQRLTAGRQATSCRDASKSEARCNAKLRLDPRLSRKSFKAKSTVASVVIRL